jgi:hypothetical protein
MVSFLAPGFLVAAGIIAVGVVAVHFIVTSEPRSVQLPTARFAPEQPVRARSRKTKLDDLLLLAARVLLILAVGAGLAKPVIDPPHQDVARVVLVDRSRAVADPAEVADSARSLLRDGDALVLFDSVAVVTRDGALDTLAALAVAPVRGNLSAGLIAGLRAASELRELADSIELVIVSPLAAEAVDAATDSIRALWPGAIRLLAVAPRPDTALRVLPVAFEGAADDPLRFAFPGGRLASGRGGSGVLLLRDAPTAGDSAWVRDGERVLVYWPAAQDSDDAPVQPPVPPGWSARESPDTIGGLVAGGSVVVAPFRRWAAHGGNGGQVVARWSDGAPAAVVVPAGDGCIRTVTVEVPARGDLVLQPRFRRITEALTTPCTDVGRSSPLDPARTAVLAGGGADRYVAGAALPVPDRISTPLVPWLFAAALFFAALALLLRRLAASNAENSRPGGER